MNFNPQPGDTVTIRAWDDMAEEYGLNESGQIKTPYISILKSMKQFCGNSYIVKKVYYTSESKSNILSCSFYDFSFYFPICALSSYSTSLSFDSLIQPLITP